MMQGTPKLFIVKGKVTGSREQPLSDTMRNIGATIKPLTDTLRILTRTNNNLLYDTVRIIKNFNNIHFDTCRKINNQINNIYNDTYRRVYSDNETVYYSLYVHATDGTPIECVLYKYTDYFPFPDKYVTVPLENGEMRYLPLAPVGSEYDSGLRYTEDNGTVWQICSTITFNIIDRYFVKDNFMINVLNTNRLQLGLSAIFGSRVSVQNDYVFLRFPQTVCGLTKVFMIGIYLEIAYSEDGINYTVYNTYDNGLCHTSYGGDNKHKANAMLVSLEPNRTYRFRVQDTYKNLKYDATEITHACIIFGKDVEKLPNMSGNYDRLTKTTSYCTIDNQGFITEADDNTDMGYKYASNMINMWLKYTNSPTSYNYYDATTVIEKDK